MSPYRTFIKWITPLEARPVVSELMSQAQQVRTIKGQVQAARNELDGSWVGGTQRNTALQNIDALIVDYNNFANSLDSKAREIAAVTVWTEVKEWFNEVTGSNH